MTSGDIQPQNGSKWHVGSSTSKAIHTTPGRNKVVRDCTTPNDPKCTGLHAYVRNHCGCMLICKSTKLPSLALENSQPQFSIQSNSRENNILAIWMPFQKGKKNHLALAGWLRNRHAAINAATKPRPHLRGELACRWNNAMLIQTPKSVTIHPLASECKFPVPVCSIQSKLSVENYTTMNKAHQSLQNDHCTILFDFGPAQHHETRACFTFRTSQVSSSWTRGGRFVGCQWPDTCKKNVRKRNNGKLSKRTLYPTGHSHYIVWGPSNLTHPGIQQMPAQNISNLSHVATN